MYKLYSNNKLIYFVYLYSIIKSTKYCKARFRKNTLFIGKLCRENNMRTRREEFLIGAYVIY